MNLSSTQTRLLLLALLIVSLAGTAYFFLRSRPAPAPEPAAAWDYCKEIVLAEVPAPVTTAFYPFHQSNVTADSPEMVRVMMRLETQDFGGNMVEVNALCRLRWKDAKFDLISLQMR